MTVLAVRDQNIVPDLRDRANEIGLPDLAEELVRALEERGWVTNAKAKLTEDIPVSQMWDVASELILAANEIFEERLKEENINVQRDKNYYSTPILPAWEASPSVAKICLPNFQRLLFEELKLRNQNSLILPKSRKDLEAFESARELFSSVFWEEIKSLYLRQHGANWGGEKRFREHLTVLPESDREKLLFLSSIVGGNIHAIRALDVTKQWAYYFVHVAPKREADFLGSINSNSDLDLLDYGQVVGSEYESKFRLRQTVRSAEFYRSRLREYAKFSKKHQLFLYGQSPGLTNRVERNFEKARFESAMVDFESLEDLSEHLAKSADFDPAANDELPLIPKFEDLSPVGLQGRATEELLSIMLERSLSLVDLRAMGRLITAPAEFDLEAELSPVKAAVHLLGGDDKAFDIVDLLIVGNRRLNNPALMASAIGALALLPFANLTWIPLAINRLLAPFAKDAKRKAQQEIELSLGELSRKSAALDLMYRLSGSKRTEVAKAIKDYCRTSGDSEESIRKIRSLLVGICLPFQRQKEVIAGSDAINKAGLRVTWNIVNRLVNFALSKDANGEENKLFLLEKQFIWELQSLSFIGKAIEERNPTEKRSILERLLPEALDKACDVANYPKEKRPRLLAKIVEELLQHDRAPDGRWVEKVQVEQTALTAPTKIELPTKAPAIWRDDKQPGDNPPDFIKRHYGPWLRANATGLTKADLRKLDFSLYTSLANWLHRQNTMPEDCPVPTLSERIDREVEVLPSRTDSKEFARLAMAKIRRDR